MAPTKKPKAITVLKKEGGRGPARYDHDHRFNVVFFTPTPKNIYIMEGMLSMGLHRLVSQSELSYSYANSESEYFELFSRGLQHSCIPLLRD